MKLFITCVIIILFVVLGLSFGAQNDTQIEVNYLIAKDTFSFPAVVACVLVAGFLLGWLATASGYFSARMKHGRLLRKYKKLQKQLDSAEQ
ncbi:LapA family protein [Echinimonas agarilytica]|uniref:Lipopolysaccharide assembly protein LapA domain-containing protein n=1 Tax=Echinimonas agarilytica TaxID=1215918 RepID=A0AA41W669_9GAMM|nr:lipopolysaccharide assembly protein LapA domain-containing protein [Echinimonas agarilytica]MCM2679353.1 lipopolysaccharide assembly protein LapA domain-containing protein [Echinimonas agarilytica]